MKKEINICAKCQKKYERFSTEKRGSNGAIVYISKEGTRLVGNSCRECRRDREKKYWSENKKVWKDYERGIDGFLMRKYRNMLSRVRGIVKNKSHLYLGLDICGKEDFYRWSKNSEIFNSLFEDYIKSGYSRKLSPSVDRVNPLKGYTFDNMEWVTFSENCRRGGRN